MPPRNLSNHSEVIRALGGAEKYAASLSKVKRISGRGVEKWIARRKFNAHFYVVMTGDLADIGCAAPASLWGMYER